MYCEQCGAELEHDARFCSTCGKPVGDEGAQFSLQHVLQTVPTWWVGLLGHKWLIAGPLVLLVLGGALFWMFGSEEVDISNETSPLTTEHASELSRSTAKTKIAEKVEPVTRAGLLEPILLQFHTKKVTSDSDRHPPKEGVVPARAIKDREKEMSAGLINISYAKRDSTGTMGGEITGYRYVYRVTPTEAGARYVDSRSGQVKLADRQMIEVTGITKPAADMSGKIMSNVDFTYKLAPTPFGEIYPPSLEKDKTFTGRAIFGLYDDGWRLERLSYNR